MIIELILGTVACTTAILYYFKTKNYKIQLTCENNSVLTIFTRKNISEYQEEQLGEIFSNPNKNFFFRELGFTRMCIIDKNDILIFSVALQK
jgi:hypothetical protein